MALDSETTPTAGCPEGLQKTRNSNQCGSNTTVHILNHFHMSCINNCTEQTLIPQEEGEEKRLNSKLGVGSIFTNMLHIYLYTYTHICIHSVCVYIPEKLNPMGPTPLTGYTHLDIHWLFL